MDTLDSIVIKRPPPTPYHPQHLCLDKGYDFPEIESGVIKRRYVPHIRHKGENLDDVVVDQTGQQRGLPVEPLDEFRVGREVLLQDLDGRGPLPSGHPAAYRGAPPPRLMR